MDERTYNRGDTVHRKGLEYVVGVKSHRNRERLPDGRTIEVRAGECGDGGMQLRYGVVFTVSRVVDGYEQAIARRVEENIEVRSTSRNRIGVGVCLEDAWLSLPTIEAIVGMLREATAV